MEYLKSRLFVILPDQFLSLLIPLIFDLSYLQIFFPMDQAMSYLNYKIGLVLLGNFIPILQISKK